MSHPDAMDPLFFSFQLAVAGRYSLDRELGRGGMGIVYLAREVQLDRSVAIKLLPPERASQRTLKDRFLREARLAAKLSHPNIIPIHAVEETGGFVFYVMAFVDGETLAQRVRARGPLSSTEGARVLREVAWALAHAHEHGLVHRDVKPDNILLESSTGRVLVADFGIAAAFGDAGDGISGTPEFMSPEQALGTTLDARSDLYGLGATAFYAFSGRFPFEGKTPTEVLAKQVTEPAPPLSSLGLSVPRKIAALVDRCLAKAPDQRPDSAQALAEQLSVALELRKELPVALRAFVKRHARFDGGGTIIAWTGMAVLSTGVSALTDTIWGFATFALLATSVPFAYMTNAARRLLNLGFAHRDLDAAFKAEAERSKEELTVERRVTPYRLERWLPAITKAAWATYVVTLAATVIIMNMYPQWQWVRSGFRVYPWLMLSMTFSGIAAIGTSIALIALRQRHQDVDNEFWSKIWVGRVGRWAFRLAAKLLPPGVRPSAMTHRATELSLGMAAEQLFDSLPKETRQALGDIPGVLRRLQDDAQELRKRHESVNDAIAEAGDATSVEYAEVREMRDALHAKLADAVGALETIRLNLLRLHAGSTTVESVTTHLDLAAEVSAEVERLIAAHGEVERALKFPRTPATTPV
jgi:serine/threonine-protein kinase